MLLDVGVEVQVGCGWRPGKFMARKIAFHSKFWSSSIHFHFLSNDVRTHSRCKCDFHFSAMYIPLIAFISLQLLLALRKLMPSNDLVNCLPSEVTSGGRDTGINDGILQDCRV